MMLGPADVVGARGPGEVAWPTPPTAIRLVRAPGSVSSDGVGNRTEALAEGTPLPLTLLSMQ